MSGVGPGVTAPPSTLVLMDSVIRRAIALPEVPVSAIGVTVSPLGRILTAPGVYVPQSDSFLLAEAMRREGVREGSRVLDMCTGSGALDSEHE